MKALTYGCRTRRYVKHWRMTGSLVRARLFGSVAALALLVVSLPAVALAEVHTAIPPRDFATVCTHDPSVNPPFFDVGVPHNLAVNCAARFNLVKGVGEGMFHPFVPLRRDQAATVVRNWLEAAFGFALPDEPTHPFTDLDGNVHAPSIALLADIGILTGVTDDTFIPTRFITRGQFATMMRRAISYADQLTITGELPPDAVVPFNDIVGTVHANSVQAIAAIGVLTGFPDGTARPGEPLTRGQLATFLMRAAAYLHTFDRWEQSVVPRTFTQTFTVTQSNENDADGEEVSEPVTLFSVPVRMVVYGFSGEIALRVTLSDHDRYLAEPAPEPKTDPDPDAEPVPEPQPVRFAAPGLILTHNDGSYVALLATADALNGATGVYEAVIAESTATLRFSVLSRSFDQFQLRLSLTDRPPLILNLSQPE